MAACGTDSGYKAHRARKEEACDACKQAHNTHEHGKETRRPYQLAYSRARSRTLSRLARNHPGEYASLLAEEFAKEEVTP